MFLDTNNYNFNILFVQLFTHNIFQIKMNNSMLLKVLYGE